MDFLCLDFINSRWFKSHSLFEELLENRQWVRGLCEKWELPVPDVPGELTGVLLELRSFLHQAACELCAEKSLSAATVAALNARLRPVALFKVLEADGNKLRLNSIPQEYGSGWIVFMIVLSFAELAAEYDAKRIKLCGNPACGWIFYDESKSRTRKWCENTCASLIKVRRFRENRRRADLR